MPIRFRCAYCNQLLGIARRKAGTVVSCPTCKGQVVVPQAEEAEVVESDAPQKPLVFERPDFDEVFNQPVKTPRSDPNIAAIPTPGSSRGGGARIGGGAAGKWVVPPSPTAGSVDVVPVEPDEYQHASPEIPAAGFVLTHRQVRIAALAAVAGLVAAFALGLFIGLSMRPAPPEGDEETNPENASPVDPKSPRR